jgi:hypothetical protein
MFNRMNIQNLFGVIMRKIRIQLTLLMSASMLAGCTVYETAPTPPPPAPVAYYDGPVVQGDGVYVIEEEPAPEYRVYVYDPGYPPGTYYYNGFYYYGGYRYEHDVFVNRYVVVNVRENRYANVEENRRAGAAVAQQQRVQYQRVAAGPQYRQQAPGYQQQRKQDVRLAKPRPGQPQ